jgi:hypothetical protein
MTALHDQCEVIRGWLNLGEEVYPDSVVTSWVRMAEEALSKRLRCKDMIQIDVGTLIEERYLLPSDWRQLDFVRVIGGKSLRYIPRDDFYNTDEPQKSDQEKCYTIAGNYLIVGGNIPEGLQVEITYYQDIPPLGDEYTWLQIQYPTLFLMETLKIASMYSIEDERGPLWESQSDKLVGDINDEHANSKASGSRLTSRYQKLRSFG